MSSARVCRRVNAPHGSVYRALPDARAAATWMAPAGMTRHVHELDPREGGAFRISLRYDAPTGAGKTTAPPLHPAAAARRREVRVDIDWTLLGPLLAVFVLTILLTGPGMWSEKWGWWWMKERSGRGAPPADPDPE